MPPPPPCSFLALAQCPCACGSCCRTPQPITEAERGGCVGPCGHFGVQRALTIPDLMCVLPRFSFWNGKEMVFIVLCVPAQYTPLLTGPHEIAGWTLLPAHFLDKKTEAWRR